MDIFIGTILAWAPNFTPRGFGSCEGALLPISSNSTLFSLLGTMYGGDGRVTFALPDLRGRAPIGIGRHPGSAYDWRQGQQGGQETVTLTLLEMPQHSHNAVFTGNAINGSASIPAVSSDATTDTPSSSVHLAKGTSKIGFNSGSASVYSSAATDTTLGGSMSFSGVASGTVSVQSTGGSQGHNNIQPILVIRYVIAMTGTYPPRS